MKNDFRELAVAPNAWESWQGALSPVFGSLGLQFEGGSFEFTWDALGGQVINPIILPGSSYRLLLFLPAYPTVLIWFLRVEIGLWASLCTKHIDKVVFNVPRDSVVCRSGRLLRRDDP
jgi:hypothetical protein